ncbi:MAG: HEAT repeat domain-containing protein [Candidatus Wallbacteria bacterium]|nr:HEAT repeat domain-containing protein [Candidatus Wallbacteria bacterium]
MLLNIKNSLDSKDVEVRRTALRSLLQSKIDETERLSLLEKVFKQDENPELRSVARKYYDLFLHKLEKERKNETLFQSGEKKIDPKVLDDGTPDEKVEFLKKLTSRQEKIEKEVLIKKLSEEKDVFVLATLISCLGVLGESQDADSLLSFLSHHDSRVKANTIDTLSLLKKDALCERIIPLLRDPDARVKANAANYLKSMGLQKTMTTLKAMIKSGKRYQIESAIYALSKIKTPESSKLQDEARKLLKSQEMDNYFFKRGAVPFGSAEEDYYECYNCGARILTARNVCDHCGVKQR